MKLPTEAALRHFARTVFSDRLSGDEVVRIVRSEAEADGGADSVEVFRRFVAKWRELTAATDEPAIFTDRALLRAMGPPPPEDRLVVLLADVMDFSTADAERILSPLSRPVAELLEHGRERLIGSRTARAVIVEDEPLIAADIQDILAAMNVEVAATTRTADAGAAAILAEAPDIVLADYNLDGSRTGADAILQIQDHHECPVVFVTGYPDRLLTGGELDPDFIIVKPYKPEAIRAAVGHCLSVIAEDAT